jgi:hypothetical protein
MQSRLPALPWPLTAITSVDAPLPLLAYKTDVEPLQLPPSHSPAPPATSPCPVRATTWRSPTPRHCRLWKLSATGERPSGSPLLRSPRASSTRRLPRPCPSFPRRTKPPEAHRRRSAAASISSAAPSPPPIPSSIASSRDEKPAPHYFFPTPRACSPSAAHRPCAARLASRGAHSAAQTAPLSPSLVRLVLFFT